MKNLLLLLVCVYVFFSRTWGGDDPIEYLTSLAGTHGAPGEIAYDFSFNSPLESGVTVYGSQGAVELQPDGKILFGAMFPHGKTFTGSIWVPAANTNGLVRFHPDGTVDESFHPITIVQSPFMDDPDKTRAAVVARIVRQPNGKILIYGSDIFTHVNGAPRSGWARLEADGGLDTSFLLELPGHQVRNLEFLADGKILISSRPPTGEPSIFRVNPDGTTDESFQGPSEPYLSASVVQSDGKILVHVGWGMHSIHGQTRRGVARLNSDGTLDTTFLDPRIMYGHEISEPGGVMCMALQPDGKILIGGEFNRVGGVYRKGVARLNSNGTLDTTFNAGAGLPTKGHYVDSFVQTFALEANGRILIGGFFDSVDRIARTNLARLNSNGSLDLSFNSAAAGTLFSVSRIIIEPDGNLLISGSPHFATPVPNNRLFRLYGGDLLPNLSISRTGNQSALSWSSQEGAGYILEFSETAKGPWIPELSAPALLGDSYLLPIHPEAPSRFYRLRKD